MTPSPPYALITSIVTLLVSLCVYPQLKFPTSIAFVLGSIISVAHHTRLYDWNIRDDLFYLDILSISVYCPLLTVQYRFNTIWLLCLCVVGMLIMVPKHVVGIDKKTIHAIAACHAASHVLFATSVWYFTSLIEDSGPS